MIVCPTCGSDTVIYLGMLGRKRWYRCRDCGMEFTLDSGEVEEDTDARS